jgi:hypothetical protein
MISVRTMIDTCEFGGKPTFNHNTIALEIVTPRSNDGPARFDMRNVARGAAISRDERPAAVPGLSAAQAQSVVASHTPVGDRTREVSHSPVAARKRTVVAPPGLVVDRIREADHNPVVARKHMVVAPPGLVADRSREVGHSRAATHKHAAAAHSRVVAPRTSARVAGHKRTAVADDRVMDRSWEGVHSRVVADKPAAASSNHVGIQNRTVVNRVADRSREAAHNRAAAGSHPGPQQD